MFSRIRFFLPDAGFFQIKLPNPDIRTITNDRISGIYQIARSLAKYGLLQQTLFKAWKKCYRKINKKYFSFQIPHFVCKIRIPGNCRMPDWYFITRWVISTYIQPQICKLRQAMKHIFYGMESKMFLTQIFKERMNSEVVQS